MNYKLAVFYKPLTTIKLSKQLFNNKVLILVHKPSKIINIYKKKIKQKIVDKNVLAFLDSNYFKIIID